MARHVVELARASLTGAEREGERRLAVLFGAGDEGIEPAEPARPPAWLWPGPTWSRPCVRGARRGGGGPSGSHLGVAPRLDVPPDASDAAWGGTAPVSATDRD